MITHLSTLNLAQNKHSYSAVNFIFFNTYICIRTIMYVFAFIILESMELFSIYI